MQSTTDAEVNTQATSTQQPLPEAIKQVDYQEYFAHSPTTIAQGDDDADGDD